MANFNEHSLEMSIMELFQDEGYIYLNGEQIHRERSEVLLIDDLRKYLLNRYAADGLTPSEVDSIILRLRSISGTIYEANKTVCKMICDGFIFNREDHTKKDLYIELIDFDEPEKNVFKIINQFEIEGINNQLRIPDGIVFINGIPVVVLEFKSAVKENRGLLSMPEIIPASSMQQLSNDGISFIKKSSTKLCHHIIEINRLISDRINNCKSLFPIWINWTYIKELFIMPNGLTEDGTKDAADIYYASLSYYPYQMYINWVPMDEGNVLYNDKKFATLLYQWHCDAFTEYSKVSDAGAFVKNNIYDFIDDSEKTVLVVDCENSDPYKLCATLKNLDYEVMQKITAIILFDDVHTATAWRILENYTRIPVEHIMIERIKQNKSLVDIKLTARACQEHYQKQVDSFVIVSSDSDYWGLISSLPDARFLVMIEREKCGPDMKAALAESGIFYCYLDDFYSGNSEDIKKNALFKEMYRWIDNSVHLNVNDMFDAALRNTRIEMSPAERRQFYEKHIRHMTLTIDENGNVSIELKRG